FVSSDAFHIGYPAFLISLCPWYHFRTLPPTGWKIKDMITPISTSTTLPDHISVIAKERWNWIIVYPRPAEDANISEITIKIRAIDSDWRIPAIICGMADGRIRYRIRANPSMR